MAGKIWFGIPGKHMQWTPAPLVGAESQNVGYVESMAFENGGADIVRSTQYRKQYNFQFSGLSADLEGVQVYNKFASGFYGSGLVHFADPYAYETNLFSAGWASPGLAEQGWKPIFGTTPTFVNTAANTFNQPPRSAVYNIDTAAAAVPTASNSIFTIVIPPTHTLRLGFSGSVTGTGAVLVRPILTNGTYGTVVSLTALSPTGATRTNYNLDGSANRAVEIFLSRTTSDASTVTIASLMAKLYPTSITPVVNVNHFPGEGHTGLDFLDEARVETYTFFQPPRKAMSTTLMEVGAWK